MDVETCTNNIAKKNIEDAADAAIRDFLRYDRRNDEVRFPHTIEDAIIHKVITVDELIDRFRKRIDVAVLARWSDTHSKP